MVAQCTTPAAIMHHFIGDDAPSSAVKLHFLSGVRNELEKIGHMEMEESVVLVSFCCFFAHICSRPSLLLSTDRVPRQTERGKDFLSPSIY